MATLQAHRNVQQALGLASQALRAGDAEAADRILTPHLERSAADPKLLHVAGLVRMHQQRFEEAADFFAAARAADPREAVLAFSHGTALRWLERPIEAIEAFKDAIKLKPDYAEAYYEAGTALQQLGEAGEAEKIFRQWLTALPDNARGKLALADVLLVLRRLQEAESLLRQALQQPVPQQMRGILHKTLGLALHRQNKDIDALENYEKSAALNPEPTTDAIRAEILQRLKRYEEAAALSSSLVARDPGNPQWHKFHNDLMYRLGRDDYLKSYDRAPRTAELLLSKAYFLSHQKRGEEAYQAYSEALALEPDNQRAAVGMGNTLNMMKRHGEAQNVLDSLLAQHSDEPDLLSCAAEAAISAGDPQKAAALCEKSLALAPYDQVALAILGTAWRMLGDERDETLNGYDSLIKIYDLDPPQGFSDMESFNVELNAWLDRVHPATREYLEQSLRNGTQTPDKLFGAGHDLVERLQLRIRETISRYIADMKQDDKHPLLSRRARNFDYTGSWSSRLRDCGFHTNHVHPEGWISSCYYVALPPAVEDTETRQGWIKFGDPALDVTLKDPIRRAIQPRPGRLVLFPSYMWHGTIPFHDAHPRTTIAFDVIPKT
ncbi:MAG TPA: tetratricopeptide repeat protein [Rhizomicrobium sp.]|nr:tetratricopeptide repeat protein [Rhizomicrobium sp.]